MHRPMQEAKQLIIDAVNVGLSAIHKAPEEELRESVLGFIKKYSFLGFMTALPTTVNFAARSARISLMFINQGKRKKGNKNDD